MKISRQKKVKKRLIFYVRNFGFHEPYQILMDGTYANACLQKKIGLRNLDSYMNAKIKYITTACCIIELEKLGSKFNAARKILSDLIIHKCGHSDKPISGYECLKSMVSNRNPDRYMIATQDDNLQKYIRSQASVPLIHLCGNAPTLVEPSRKAEQVLDSLISKDIRESSKRQNRVLKKLMKENGLATDSETAAKKLSKRKRAKGPNPLSCKKKTVFEKRKNRENTIKVDKKIVRIPEHVRNELLNRIQEQS